MKNKESLIDRGDGDDQGCDKRRKKKQYFWARYARTYRSNYDFFELMIFTHYVDMYK